MAEVDEGFVFLLMRLIQSASTPEEVARIMRHERVALRSMWRRC
jgi:hypothetical protein